MTETIYFHWRCDCGAHGYSNELEANALILRLHRERGHTVTAWNRGQRDRSVTYGPKEPSEHS